MSLIHRVGAWLQAPVLRARRAPTRRTALLALGLIGSLAASAPWAGAHLRSAALLLSIVGQPDPTGLLHHWTQPVRQQEVSLVLAGRSVRARRYIPFERGGPPGIVLLHGVHYRGMDEARLRAFANALARAGIDVLTPELPELKEYRVEPTTIAQIDDAARLHAQQLRRAGVGVVGISFAGGLSLLAAARQPEPTPIGYVVTVGAHDDLARLARYYAGAPLQDPDGVPLTTRPHPYGARVIVRAHVERFFADADIPAANAALDAYLHDQQGRARELAGKLSAAGRQRMLMILDPAREAELGELLLKAVDANRTELARVSPHGQLAPLRVPVFLVHGSGDPIIPSVETRFLARQIPAPWLRRVVVSPVLRHAELERDPGVREHWDLVHFMGDVLLEAERH